LLLKEKRMEENKRKQIKRIKTLEGKYIKKINIVENKEEKPSVGCFQLVVVENIPWYKKVIRKVFGIFKLKITISRI